MDQILSYFIFDIVGIIGLSTLFVVFLIQLFFYFLYYKKPLRWYKKTNRVQAENKNLPSVSVIIVVKDESENLAKNLPFVLEQNYPDYEVVVVNDGSTDESEFLLKKFKKEYSHLYSTFSPISYENESRRQKILSLTIGIKAATKDILLFTEADTKPMTRDWITSIMSNMTSDKDIVLGYCKYENHKGFWNKTAVFDNLIFALQYMSMALKNKPFTGVYRNIAYRRKLFFDNKGFSSALKYDNAEKIFLNNIMTESNTAVSLSESGFVSCELNSFSLWKYIKINYMRAKSHFTNFNSKRFYLESATRYLFYILVIGIMVYSGIFGLWPYLGAAFLFFIFRFLFQFFTLKKAGKFFQTKYFFFLLPIMDIFQPYYNSYFYRYSRKKAKRKRRKKGSDRKAYISMPY